VKIAGRWYVVPASERREGRMNRDVIRCGLPVLLSIFLPFASAGQNNTTETAKSQLVPRPEESSLESKKKVAEFLRDLSLLITGALKPAIRK
jgi:hypothetical protein